MHDEYHYLIVGEVRYFCRIVFQAVWFELIFALVVYKIYGQSVNWWSD